MLTTQGFDQKHATVGAGHCHKRMYCSDLSNEGRASGCSQLLLGMAVPNFGWEDRLHPS